MVFGYARVSSKEQNLARQLKQLEEANIDKRNIYTDKQSGKDTNRENYQLLTRRLLREGDCLVVSSLDRISRNFEDLRNEWSFLTQTLKCQIKVLDFPLLDTSTDDDLLNKLISTLVLNLLSYVSQVEREKIRSRQEEGIKICLERQGEPGVKHYGRPIVDFPQNYVFVITKWENGEIRGRTAREELGLKKTTFYKLYKDYKAMSNEEREKIGMMTNE